MIAAMMATLASAPESLSETEDITVTSTPAVTTVTRNSPEQLPVVTLPPITTSDPVSTGEGTTTRMTVSGSSDELESYTPGTIPGVSLELEQRFDRLAQCESNGDWSINTGNGYHGGLQFHPPTWNAYGGQEFAPYAYQASREEQMQVAKKVLDGQGWGAWPACTASFGWR